MSHLESIEHELSEVENLSEEIAETEDSLSKGHTRIVDLSAPHRTGGADPHGLRSQGLHHEGDEFHALRPYVIGDDLRRVHWPATAHSGDLVVRQLDRAVHQLGPMFTPENTGVDAASARAVARALRDADCGKSLPLALDYLGALPKAALGHFKELHKARLDSVKFFYGARSRE